MTEFIENYGGTTVVAVIIAIILFFAVRKIVKDKKSGKNCSCGCEGCAYKDNCHKN
ncbi:MAG: FeoB-associated Cys-rich membrane protein [Clostridia bacterium]|nr:FeoB-associated Cys-rich membrane protein [Clostridia bacterium]